MKRTDCPSFLLPPGTEYAPPRTRRPSAHDIGLTVRQAEVLGCMLQGLPNKLICRRLSISPGTVKNHVSAILRALHVANRTQAVVMANRLGFAVDGAPEESGEER